MYQKPYSGEDIHFKRNTGLLFIVIIGETCLRNHEKVISLKKENSFQ